MSIHCGLLMQVQREQVGRNVKREIETCLHCGQQYLEDRMGNKLLRWRGQRIDPVQFKTQMGDGNVGT